MSVITVPFPEPTLPQQPSVPRAEESLLIEWPRGEAAPTTYELSPLPPTTPRTEFVRLAKLRWRIERDSQALTDALCLEHFAGRGWRGFHHHASVCLAAYAFLVAERVAHVPPQPLAFLRSARLPKGFTPWGAPRAACQRPPKQSHPGSPIEGQCDTVTWLLGVG